MKDGRSYCYFWVRGDKGRSSGRVGNVGTNRWCCFLYCRGGPFFFNFLRVLRLVRDWRIIFFLPLGSGSITDCLLGCGGWEVGLDMCGCFRGSACC